MKSLERDAIVRAGIEASHVGHVSHVDRLGIEAAIESFAHSLIAGFNPLIELVVAQSDSTLATLVTSGSA